MKAFKDIIKAILTNHKQKILGLVGVILASLGTYFQGFNFNENHYKYESYVRECQYIKERRRINHLMLYKINAETNQLSCLVELKDPGFQEFCEQEQNVSVFSFAEDIQSINERGYSVVDYNDLTNEIKKNLFNQQNVLRTSYSFGIFDQRGNLWGILKLNFCFNSIVLEDVNDIEITCEKLSRI